MKKIIKSWKKIIIFAILIVLVISVILYETVFRNKIVDTEYKSFVGLDDVNLQTYVMDDLYASINSEFNSDEYEITEMFSTYVSKEYLEEVEYNSKTNVYFGFTLDELAAQFNDKKFVFTVNDNNQTDVKEFEDFNENYTKMIKNVVIGSGVIITCAIVSVVSSGTSIAIIFAASAKTATTFALSSATMSGVIAGGIEYYNSGDIKQAVEKASLEASEGFKSGAIIGAITGGATAAVKEFKSAKAIKNLNFIDRGKIAENRAVEKYGGRAQVAYLNGKEVPFNTSGATRVDIERVVDGHLEGIEVKNYNLNSKVCRKALVKDIKREINDRVQQMPKGSTQRVVLDIRGRNYDKKLLKSVIKGIKNSCEEVYHNLPVDVLYN